MRGMLVIDDAKKSLESLTTLLQSHGHQVIVLESHNDMTKALQQHDIALAFMSLQCPHVDKLCEQLRCMAEGVTLPLFLVGYKTAQVSSAMAAQQLGADGYLSLPLHQPEVVTLLHTYLGSPATQQATKQPTQVDAQHRDAAKKLATCIVQKFEQIHFADYPAILEIPHTANTKQIEEAYQRLAQKFAPDTFPATVQQRYHAELLDIAVVLRDAYQVLACPTQRQPYLEACALMMDVNTVSIYNR